MKKLFNFLATFFKNEYKANPQILWLPILFLIWAASVPILRMFDPTAAVFDAGIFQIPIYGTILFVFALFISWQVLRVIYSSMHWYLKKEFKNDFPNFTPWQKTLVSLSVFFLLLFLLAMFMLTL
jgi:hypothetical protein